MKILLLALLALSLPATVMAAPAKAPVAPNTKTNIDARGVAVLNKAVAFYRQQKSFAVVATETIELSGASPRRTRYELALQTPQRAALKTIKAAPVNPDDHLSFALVNANALLTSTLGQPAQTTPLKGEQERAQALLRVFTPTPSLALSVVSFAIGINPATTPRITAVRYSEIRDEGRPLKNVVVVGQDAGDPNPLVLEYRLAPQTHELRKLVIRRTLAGKNATIVTRFEPLVPNWKGSQAATDNAVYNWNKLAPRIAVAAPTPKAQVSIDPAAVAIFARAAALYQELDGLHLEWKVEARNTPLTGETPSYRAALDFERAGRLRLADPEGLESLIVIDGQRRWGVNSSDFGDGDDDELITTYQSEKLDEGDAPYRAIEELQTADSLTFAVSSLLEGSNQIEGITAETLAQIAAFPTSQFRAALLPAQPFDGQACDLVRITTRFINPYTTASGETVKQETFWFSRSDGRLVRLQMREVEGQGAAQTTDEQVTEQTFNPTFAPDFFKFTPPRGAVLSKD